MSQALPCLLIVCHEGENKKHLAANSDACAVESDVTGVLEEIPLGLG